MSTYDPIGPDQTTETYAKTLETAFNAAGCATKTTKNSEGLQLEVSLNGKKETLDIKSVAFTDTAGLPEGCSVLVEPTSNAKVVGIKFMNFVEAYSKNDELAKKSIDHNTKAIVKKVTEKLKQ